MSLKTIVKSVLPLSCGVYWYFTAYAVLYVFRPYIDTVLAKLDDTEAKRLLAIVLLFFCGSGILMDAYQTAGGYSGLWISVMYVVGYLMKRVKLFENVKSRYMVAFWIAINVMSWLLFLATGSTKLITYISPITVLSAIFLVVLFSRAQPNERIVRAIAPFTFGIYLFQSNRFVYENTLNRLDFVKNSSSFATVFFVFAFAIMLFVIGLIVDRIRFAVFKVLRINNQAERLNALSQNILNKLTGANDKCS